MNGMNGNAGQRMNSNWKGLLWIVLGVIICGHVLDGWDAKEIFKDWWPLIIIVPCFSKVTRYGFQTGAGFGLVVGVLLLLSRRGLFDISIGGIFKLAIPVMLILFGAKVLLKGARFQRNTSNIPPEFGDDVKCSAFFGGADVVYPREPYFGSEVNAVFGGADLDLRNALIDEDIVIHVSAIFGGAEIRLPEDVNVRVDSTGIFGGTDNCIKRPEQPEWPIVYINSTAIFGGVEIK
ncbi:MAG: hypothetical protein IJY09_05890 [Lachnospiraceae bacterium]|nr:hypothetical protein [Lachnospiraceae bacterium]